MEPSGGVLRRQIAKLFALLIGPRVAKHFGRAAPTQSEIDTGLVVLDPVGEAPRSAAVFSDVPDKADEERYSAEDLIRLWHSHLAWPEQDLEEMVCQCARMEGFRSFPSNEVPEQILAVPQLHRAWVRGWNRALYNSRFDFDKWVKQGCP